MGCVDPGVNGPPFFARNDDANEFAQNPLGLAPARAICADSYSVTNGIGQLPTTPD